MMFGEIALGNECYKTHADLRRWFAEFKGGDKNIVRIIPKHMLRVHTRSLIEEVLLVSTRFSRKSALMLMLLTYPNIQRMVMSLMLKISLCIKAMMMMHNMTPILLDFRQLHM